MGSELNEADGWRRGAVAHGCVWGGERKVVGAQVTKVGHFFDRRQQRKPQPIFYIFLFMTCFIRSHGESSPGLLDATQVV